MPRRSIETCLAETILVRPDGSYFLRGFRFAKSVKGLVAHSSLDYEARRRAPNETTDQSMPAHPAPEQRSGTRSSAASDMFAFGCVLYAAATGTSPFSPDPSLSWQRPVPVRRVARDVPSDLAQVIDACLGRVPQGRPAADQLAGGSADEAKRSRRLGAALAGCSLPRGRRLLRLPVGQPLERSAASGDAQGALWPWRQQRPLLSRGRALRSGVCSLGKRSLIGVSHYAHYPDLPNAVHDVDLVAERLRSLSLAWDVTVLPAGQSDHRGNPYGPSESAYGPGDRRSGIHLLPQATESAMNRRGKADGGCRAMPELDNEANWIRFGELQLFYEECDAKHILITMDCCYGGLLSRMRSGEPSYAEEQLTTRKAHVALMSGLPDQRVTDGSTRNSPFALAFDAAFDCEAATLTSTDLLASIRKNYEANRVLGQLPLRASFSEGSGGDFVFFLGQDR